MMDNSLSDTWFTSDTHFNHQNIIPFERPQYRDLDEMNRDLIARWNARVKPGDTIYHLGDFALGHYVKLAPVVAQLNGDIQLTLGNHDWNATRMADAGIPGATKDRMVYFGTLKLWLAHIPSDNGDDTRKLKRPYRWPDEYDIELCGHVHSQWRTRRDPNGRSVVNVGVDVWDLQPISLLQVLEAL